MKKLMRIINFEKNGKPWYRLEGMINGSEWNMYMEAPIVEIDGQTYVSTEFIYQLRLAARAGSVLVQGRE